MIAIIDYKTANLGSIVNMCKRLGLEAVVVSDPKDLAGADRILLPGIGHFDTCISNLQEAGFVTALEELVLGERAVPLLGICVGAQLLTIGSEEGDMPGFGWVKAETRRFPRLDLAGYKVPHMGWNQVRPTGSHPLLNTFELEAPRFYFVHSYYMKCERPEDVVAKSTHGLDFDSAIGRGNVAGVQFHPEKSHKFGMKLLAAFATWDGVGEG